MIQELNKTILTNIAGGAFTDIASEISQLLGMDVPSLYSLIVREMCDYSPCLTSAQTLPLKQIP